MSVKRRRLDQLQVVSPCRAGWDAMQGDERKRFCGQCNKFVYDFSKMTRRQVEAIVSIHQGQLCARITRRPDGSIVMLESPPLLPAPTLPTTRRASPIVNATVAAILGLSVPSTAQNTILSALQLVAESKADRSDDQAKPGDAFAPVSGTVLDSKGEAVRGALVKLISRGGEERVMETSLDGGFLFAQVPYGSHLLLIESRGYYTHVNSNLIVDTPHELRFEVTLSAKQMFTTAGGISAGPPPSLFDLYRNSDLVAIAEAGQSAITESGDEMKLFRTSLKISSLLKGDDNAKVIPFYHWESDDSPAQFQLGDRLLVFLHKGESEDGEMSKGYVASDWGDVAIKKLDDAQLNVYRQRIEELSQILQRSDPEPAEITEWLVRLVENPITRMEGAGKLNRALLDLPHDKEDAVEDDDDVVEEEDTVKEDDAVEEETEPLEAGEENSDKQPTDEDFEKERRTNALIAAALNEDHKSRLANSLYAVAELDESDLDLVWLIQRLEDKRLAVYLASQLQRIADDAPGFAVPLTQIIASTMNDEDLSRLADDYWAAVRYDTFNPSLEANSESERRPVDEEIAALKRSALLKDFLKLFEYKTRR